MRLIFYLVILVALFFAPVERLDIADLEPVQAVAVYREGDNVILETDTQDRGRGKNVEEALAAMKKSTPTVIYLDTADFLLVAENAEETVDSLRGYLKSDIKVATYHGGPVKEEAEYVDVHGDTVRLKDWKRKR